ncbi:MAG TPA: SgcJ/EcaC family oxidoreductase [Candidatus Limnocylindrales bacterium]|nr:SgcJ/EcaC family oxidoreductase [Candidatus Limnocylindrales bacterium]
MDLAVTELEAVMERWAQAVEADDAAAVAGLFTDDGVLLSSDAPTARGRAAIEAVVRGWIEAGEENDRTETQAAFVGDDRAVLARTYEVDFVTDDGTTSERGRYLVTFRREDGAWRVEAMAIFSDPA